MTHEGSIRRVLQKTRGWFLDLPKRPVLAIFILLTGPVATLAAFSDGLSTLFSKLSRLTLDIRVARHYSKREGGEFVRLTHGYWIEAAEESSTSELGAATTDAAGHSRIPQGQRKILHFVLQEFKEDKSYVYLYDPSRAKNNDPTDPLLLRIPIRGGEVQYSYANPIVWTDFSQVSPAD